MSDDKNSEARGFLTKPGAAAITNISTAFLGSLVHAACIVQPTRRDFRSVELGDMVQRAGANKLHTTASQVSIHIRDSMHDANLLHLIRRLDEITHHTPLTHQDEEWLVQNRIAFSVSSYSLSSFHFFPTNPRPVPQCSRCSAHMVPLKYR